MISALDDRRWGVQGRVPHGVSSLYLAPGVSLLNEEEAVFGAMLEGWSMQQIGGRNLRESSVKGVLRVVRRFQAFAGEWPWRWDAAGFGQPRAFRWAAPRFPDS